MGSSRRNRPKQGKLYIPGLGKFFKISPDEMFLDDLKIEMSGDVFRKVQEMIDQMVRDKIDEVAALDRYLTKEEELVIRDKIISMIDELNDAIYDVIGEHETFITNSEAEELITNVLKDYYTKRESDELHDKLVTEFEKEEVLGYWYAMFPQNK